jgi:hypothetical protein
VSGGRVAVCVAAVAMAAGAGCGGDDRKDRERAAFGRYKTKVEAACKEVVRRIRDRGAPAQITDLLALGEPALDDIHRFAAVVEGLRVPHGAARRLGAFREDLRVLDGHVRELQPHLDQAVTTQLVAGAVEGLVYDVSNVEFSAKEAGLRCVAARDREGLETAAGGPVFLAWLDGFDRFAARRLAPFEHRFSGSPAELRRVLVGEGQALLKLDKHLDDVLSPGFVRDEAGDFELALSDYRDVIVGYAEQLRGRETVTDAFARRFNQRLERRRRVLLRHEAQLRRALERRLPAPPGQSGEAKPA